MKKVSLSSFILSILLFVGCSSDKTSIIEESKTPVEVVKKVEKAIEVIKTTEVEKPTEVIKEAKVVKAIKAETPGVDGKALYGKCVGCHGVNGEKIALGKSKIISGQKAEDIYKKLKEYKEGIRNVNGMGGLMKGQVMSYSEADLHALSKYIASFPPVK